MIAASEPLEFIPRGRQAVNEHPGPLVSRNQVNVPTEHLLLYRLQNVNISTDENTIEFWSVHEIFKNNSQIERELTHPQKHTVRSSPAIVSDVVVNAEHELYVKGTTAVWTKGICENNGDRMPRMCFTCDTPIQHAFFCPPSFFQSENPDKRVREPGDDEPNAIQQHEFAICLIDSTALRVYVPNGEEFITSLEFSVAHVWPTNLCILLERNITNPTIATNSIQMPKLFSLTHPLNEMAPVLIHINGTVSFFADDDFKIVFVCPDLALVLVYDNKLGRHFVALLREASNEEKQMMAVNNETDVLASTFNISNFSGIHNNMSHSNSFKFDTPDNKHRNLSHLVKSNIGLNITASSLNSSKQHNMTPVSYLLANSMAASFNHTQLQSPYDRLQSTHAAASAYAEEMRKVGEVRPSKPVVPEMCLEHIWTENPTNKDYAEMASHGFVHYDIIDQTYLCYLLPRTGNLLLTRLEKSNSDFTPIFGLVSSIPAKDAIALNKLRMIAILAPCGTLLLYTGPQLIGKVHVGGMLSNMPVVNVAVFGPTFPRRSSLLPTVQHEAKFEDELHLLSPVHPLQPQFPARTNNLCGGVRDPAGNRLTLTYPGGKMYRISIPLISECPFVTKCLITMRRVLKKDLAVTFISRWYGIRNAPGTIDLCSEKEWDAFKCVLSEMLGRSGACNNDTLPTLSHSSSSVSSSDEPKKRRKFDDCQGTDDDWHFLLNHLNKAPKMAFSTTDELSAGVEGSSNRTGITTPTATSRINNMTTQAKNDTSALLFPHIPLIFYSLHLLYEEMKLDLSVRQQLKYLGQYLYHLALDLNLEAYCLHYFVDYPEVVYINSSSHISETDKKKLINQQCLTGPVPNIFQTVDGLLKGSRRIVRYPHISNVNDMSCNVVKLTSLIARGNMDNCINVLNFPHQQHSQTDHEFRIPNAKQVNSKDPIEKQLINVLSNMNITRADIGRLPPALHYLLAEVLERSRSCPPTDCDPKCFELLLRPELYVNTILEVEKEKVTYKNFKNENSLCPRVTPKAEAMVVDALGEDGMGQIHTKLFRLRFPADLRIEEVRRLLTSANPVVIDITQQVGVSDHDFIEEKEKQLFAMCSRTMSLPLGRGMFTLRTCTPASTESLAIPKLCLSGKDKLKGAAIDLQQIEVPQNMSLWPTFHNGVAAGLQLTPDCRDVDSTWIVYNKPKGQQDGSTEHAGFLMALGLNGHLKSLSFMSIYDYLVKCDEMTSVGLILGISTTHRGTMDMTTTRLLSVHVEALLPATALELDIPQNIQVAAIMGLGFIYQETAKRHIAEVLLQEIGRPPGPEMENCVERESYALTAGLALGLVTLGKGESPPGLKDLQLPDTLHYYMIGGNRRPLTGSQKEKYKLPSFQVREGNAVNIDVTAPGATLALGLMFFGTGNQAIAHWMKPPDTNYLLDLVRPDLLLLRILARGLILWNDIEPTDEWLQSQFPAPLKFDLKYGPKDLEHSNLDHEASCQAYCNIIAGGSLCIGLRFAGTGDEDAFATLKKTLDLFLNMSGWYVGEYSGKATVESCLILVLLSISLVKAGAGDLDVLRVCRMLRTRLGPSNSHVTYGSHMAIHMALGFQFLGAGRFTLSRTPQSIAALVCALFPKFPNHSNDNRYHLQAFRHFYVLAIEPRMLLPRDIDSGKLCLCNIQYTTIDNKTLSKMAPCMLPELDSLAKVCFQDANYWPIVYEKGKNWDQLQRILRRSGCVDIKQKAGCLSHVDDPTQLRSFFAQTLTTEQYSCWKTHAANLLAFSKDPKVRDFISKFLPNEGASETLGPLEADMVQILSLQFYHCLTKDTMHALSIFIELLMALRKLQTNPSSYDIWQFKIITTVIQKKIGTMLLSIEHLKALTQMIHTEMDRKLTNHLNLLRRYLFSSNVNFLQDINETKKLKDVATLITFFDLPINLMNCIDLNGVSGKPNLFRILIAMKELNLDLTSIKCISDIIARSM